MTVDEALALYPAEPDGEYGGRDWVESSDAATTLADEVRRQSEENANLRAMNLSMDGRERLEWTREVGRQREALRVMAVNEGKLQLRIAQLETAARETLRQLKADPSADVDETLLERVLRSGDHADTTRDTNETRCAPGEPETRTLAEDPAGALLEEAPEEREKS